MFVREKTIHRFLPSESFQDLKSLFSTVSHMVQVSQQIRQIELANPDLSPQSISKGERDRFADIVDFLLKHGLDREDLNEWILIQTAFADLEDGRFFEC